MNKTAGSDHGTTSEPTSYKIAEIPERFSTIYKQCGISQDWVNTTSFPCWCSTSNPAGACPKPYCHAISVISFQFSLIFMKFSGFLNFALIWSATQYLITSNKHTVSTQTWVFERGMHIARNGTLFVYRAYPFWKFRYAVPVLITPHLMVAFQVFCSLLHRLFSCFHPSQFGSTTF